MQAQARGLFVAVDDHACIGFIVTPTSRAIAPCSSWPTPLAYLRAPESLP